MGFLQDLIDSLLIGLGFFYKALWPILLGVFITALIDTLVNKDKMADILGGRDLLSTGKASVAGAISSACTFGAVTITGTLFKKGASSESSFAFSFASTNLVFELGILIYILLGPAFLAAELLGGVVLIAIMYLLLRLTLPEKTFEQARARLQEQDLGSGLEAFKQGVHSPGTWKEQLSTRAGWQRVARQYFQTIGRIYKSVVWGFLLAGLIIGLVPEGFWPALFPASDSFAGVTANASLGVLAGVFSFIGSIGNVPFAAALWASGVSFGGVVALIYADLITIPVLDLWRRFLGWKATAYVFVIFFVTMVVAAVLMEYLFDTLGWIPERLRGATLEDFLAVKFDFTLVMTVLSLLGTALLLWLRQTQSARYASGSQ
ncbi:permease [Pseudonocardia nigra]|uniref:permease n=1 Tax=Pseudonocardia nigra TaxID=1921578 RepID=UPI001C5DFD76|nr:permease [Pseudonocardia nigra]